MLIDCVMVRDELDLLEARMRYLDDVVDYWVIVEGDRRFGDGAAKPFHFWENQDRFGRGLRIFWQPAALPEHGSSWEREFAQRAAFKTALAEFDPNDTVLFGDVDEFPALDQIDNAGSFAWRHRHMVFAPNLEHPDREMGTVKTRVRVAADDPQRLRTLRKTIDWIDGGFHFSWMPTDLAGKAAATAHTEHAHLDYAAARAAHIAPWDDKPLTVVDVDESWPEWFRDGSCPAGWWA